MAKSNEINNLLQSMADTFGAVGPKAPKNTCTWCGGPAEKFKDALSKKEFTISGFCQKCQDNVFGE